MRRQQHGVVIVDDKFHFKISSPTLFPLLKKVARSFYLTIRFLPALLQEPVALAYLLARASDTIADEGDFSSEEREMFLCALQARLDKPSSSIDFLTLENSFKKNSQDSECDTVRAHVELLKALPALLQELENPQRDPVEADIIRVVWRTILEGQLQDVKFFSRGEPLDLKVVTAQELDRYLYLVAGCVGEFWTQLAAHHLKSFSKVPLEQMRRWGSSYGKGLQLLNILRDAAADQRAGRFYFEPLERDQLVAQLQSFLQEGRLYVNALQQWRLRYASALPLLLAEETLALMIKNPHVPHVKMSRWKVLVIQFRGWEIF